MKKTLFLIFNHTFTSAQEADAKASLGVGEIVSMPENVRSIWADIPPENEAIAGFLSPVREWLFQNAKPGDLVLIQGDFGACHLMVRHAFENGLIPVYSTTRREAVEKVQSDGSVSLTHNFRHVRFR